MACYFPLQAYYLEGGGRLGFDGSDPRVTRGVLLACGQCIGCRLARLSSMALRCMHEAQMHGSVNNSFITLTYDDEHLPENGSLLKRDFQLFVKRLRRELDSSKRIRFLGCGEYGSETNRAHYHALIFNHRFDRVKAVHKGPTGELTYSSSLLSKVWPYGFCSSGDLSLKSAGYVCGYCLKKRVDNVTSPLRFVVAETGEIVEREAEFALMSTHPGIGASWLQKYADGVLSRDFIVRDGGKAPLPKYYTRLLTRLYPLEMEHVKYERELRSDERKADGVPARLDAREVVAQARASMLRRGG